MIPVRARHALAEARSIARSGWGRTALSTGLIALSLFLPGVLLLLTHNVARLTRGMRVAPELTLTVADGTDPRAVAQALAAMPEVRQVRIVGPGAARRRFLETFPNLAGALAELPELRFPSSLTVILVSPGREAAVERVARATPGVTDVEPAGLFERRFRAVVAFARRGALAFGALLVLAAMMSVASAVRLALDQHSEEVEIMRLMGATEAAIRAPFWLYGALSGLAGGLAALALLAGAYAWARSEILEAASPLLAFFWSGFLPAALAAAVPAAGAAAGLAGAALSVYRAEV